MNHIIWFFSIVPYIMAAQAYFVGCRFFNSEAGDVHLMSYYTTVPIFILFPITTLLVLFLISTFFIKKINQKVKYPLANLILLWLQYPVGTYVFLRVASCE